MKNWGEGGPPVRAIPLVGPARFSFRRSGLYLITGSDKLPSWGVGASAPTSSACSQWASAPEETLLGIFPQSLEPRRQRLRLNPASAAVGPPLTAQSFNSFAAVPPRIILRCALERLTCSRN